MIIAEYRSRCPACDEFINEGDAIAYEDDEWVHSQCVVELIAPIAHCVACGLQFLHVPADGLCRDCREDR